MPYRTLTPDEAARYLFLSRLELDRLVKDGDIPFEIRGDRTVFRKQNLDEWVSQRILSANPNRLAAYHQQSALSPPSPLPKQPLLRALLQPQRIATAMRSKTKASVIRDLAQFACETGSVCDLAEVVESLEAREALCSTAVPGGVAFLHPRSQQPYRFEASFVVLGRTLQPIHFGAPDGQPTDLFFLLCFQEDKLHLHTLARLCLMALKTDLLQDLRAAADGATAYAILLAAEEAVINRMR
jgi:PTS system nitrogen regulatory IIA component